MRRIYEIIYICLGAWLLAILPAKAASEAEFKKLAKTYTLHADGSQEVRVYKELSLFTHAAMNSLYGESFIVYNPAWQELKIHDSHTRQKDGTIVRTPQNAFVEVLPAAAADAPAYNGWKEMVVVHTGLELGATIYLDYSIVTRAGYLPELDVYTQVEEMSPVKEYVCTLSVPENKPLHYALVNGKTAPMVKSEQGNKVVTWTLKNVPAYYPSDTYPVLAGNVQAIVAHTYASAADALKGLRAQFAASDEAEVVALARQLVDGKSATEFESVLKSYVQGLGTCRLSLEQTGYRLRSASEVIRTAYGTEAEKLNLLVGLMKSVGLSTEVKIAYGLQTDTDNMGLSAIIALFLENQFIADLQDYQPVLDWEGKPVVLKTSPAVDKHDTLTVTAEKSEVLAGGYRLVTVPRGKEGIARYSYGSGNHDRRTNLLLPGKVDETYTCLVCLPESMQWSIPQQSKGNNGGDTTFSRSKEITNAIGTLRITMKSVGDKQLEIVRSLRLNKQLITPTEYADFRRLMSEWEDPHHTALLVKNL